MSKSKKDISGIESGAGFIGSLASKLIKKARQKGISDERIYELAREGEATDDMIDRIVNALFGNTSEYLKLISGGESLLLDECDGSEIISSSKDMFEAGIDSDFVSWGANQKGRATGKTPVDVHEMTKNATFSQLFGSLAFDVRKCCFTQHQIKNFIRKYRNWLREDGYATFFLFESNGNFFVAFVSVNSRGKLFVCVYGLGIGRVWCAEYRRRFVVPQLAVVTQ